MSNENVDSKLERRAKEAFDASVSAVDAATLARLRQARYGALEELASRRSGWRAGLAPASAAAAVALVAWLVVWQAPPTTGDVRDASLGDLEILLGEEDLEMLEEALEFYRWLEEQPEFANGLDAVG